MIDEDAPPGTILFEPPWDGGGAVLDRHLAVAGDVVALTVKRALGRGWTRGSSLFAVGTRTS